MGGQGKFPPSAPPPWLEISVLYRDICSKSYTNFSAILVFLRSTSGYSEIHFYCEIHSEVAEIRVSTEWDY